MKKLVALLLGLVLVTGMLAACSGDSSASAPAASTPAASTPAASTPDADSTAESLSGTITVWSYTDNINGVQELFAKAYPDIELDITLFGGDEYKTKLLTTLQSGTGIPDVFMMDEGYVYEFLDSDLIEDLSARGYEERLADYYDYMRESCRAKDGTIRAVNYQASPVGFWYLRDAMEQWLGTSDPDELAEMLGSWDKILEAAEKVYTDSNGTVHLWPNAIEMVKVVGYSFDPFVQNGEFSISQDWYDLLDTMRTFHNSGYLANLSSWSSDWAAEWNAGNLLIRVMPSWDFFTDWDLNDGNVGIIKPFENAYEGGSFMSMWSGSEKKELADVFLTFLTETEFQRANMEEYNQVPGNAVVAKEMADEGYSASRFGGQNLMETYYEINNGVYDIPLDKYTRSLQNEFQGRADEGILGGWDNETIIEAFKDVARDMYPELNIE